MLPIVEESAAAVVFVEGMLVVNGRDFCILEELMIRASHYEQRCFGFVLLFQKQIIFYGLPTIKVEAL